jgi:hypothetical protein
MDVREATNMIVNQFQDREWFANAVAQDSILPHQVIVLTKWQSKDILMEIPETFAGYQVLVHFSSSKPIVSPLSTHFAPASSEPEPDESQVSESMRPLDINYLIKELDRLERLCGSRTLQDIFYEIHDGKNAVTNMSSKYSEVRIPLEKLYNSFGFDVIYEEIDG